MCTAIAELDTCPNCKSADDYIYNGFKVVHIPYISADESNPVIIKVKYYCAKILRQLQRSIYSFIRFFARTLSV